MTLNGVSRDCPKFLSTPYYLRNGQSHGLQIWPVHSQGPSQRKPIKILEKRERGCNQGLPKIFKYPPLSQERVKLRTSNLAVIFTGSIQTKAHLNFWRKGSVGVSRDCPTIPYFLLSQERIKLRTSNLAGTFTVSIGTKAH